HVARMTALSDTDVLAELADLAYPPRNPMDSRHPSPALFYFLDLQVSALYLRRFEQRTAAILANPATTRAVKQARWAQRVLARLRTQTRFARQGRRAIEYQDNAAIDAVFLAARDALRPVCQRARREGFTRTWRWLST
ncbi:MAG: hypothetical protein M1482_17785, partial [Chloroflexi bacterium]|nr:hypothetical protein [Chloroflexota bacterium]